MRGKRGQAEPITVLILVSATLVVAIALYSYFTSVYAGQQRAMSLVDTVAAYAGGVRVYQEAGLSYVDPGTGDYAYCYMVSLVNRMGVPATVYVTLLPGSPGPDGALRPSPLVLEVPVAYIGDTPVERRLHVWLAADRDRDGVVEVVGQDNTGAYVVAFETVPPCRGLYANRTNLAALNPLRLPLDADDPNYGYNGSRVFLSIDGLSVTEALRLLSPDAPEEAYVPAWNITLGPGEKTQLLVFAWSPEEMEQASLVLLAKYDDRFYAFAALPLSPLSLP